MSGDSNNNNSVIAKVRKFSTFPKDNNLYVHLQQVARLIQESSENLTKLIIDTPEREEQENLVQEIRRLESAGDGVQEAISQFVGSSFTPPFPSQDINTLADVLDDILDSIKDAANLFYQHHITDPPGELIEMAKIIREMGETFNTDVIEHLKKFEHPNHVYAPINLLEAKADDIKVIGGPAILRRAQDLGQLKNAIAIGQIIAELERATNKFEKAAIIIKGVISKSV